MARYPNPSKSVASLSDTVFSTSRLVRRARELGDRVFRLHIGDTYLQPPECARAEAQLSASDERLHSYSPVHGEPALLEAIVAHHRGAIDRERLQISVGATGGLAVACKALVDPGDEVIILAPYWPLIRGIVASVGATPVEVPLYDRLQADATAFETALAAAINERTCAIYVNTPNNPTGALLPEAYLKTIAQAAEAHGLWIFSDEAYVDLTYTDTAPQPIWQRPDFAERTIAVHTFSKSYGLAGARIGYLHGPEQAMAAIRGAHVFHAYGAAKPMQIGAARALSDGGTWLAEARERYKLAAHTAADALGLPRPEGGTFLFFDAADYFQPQESILDFLERCLEAGVLLTAGGACGSAYETWVRLCYVVVPPEQLAEALARLRPLLRR